LPHSRDLQDLVRALGEVSARLSCQVIAEGVETEAQAETCRALGCQLGQGYLFGRPQAVADLTAAASGMAPVPRPG
jgi:EAL domain-containing protein (putative c-di-GMP-specific phosphodiesterase class I)